MPYPGTPHHHNHADGNPDDVIIPSPRQALDDHIENLPAIIPDQPVWSYDQQRPRGGNRRWAGHVHRVNGQAGDRLRGELADAIADLLRWATTQHQHHEDHHNGDDADDGESPDPTRRTA